MRFVLPMLWFFRSSFYFPPASSLVFIIMMNFFVSLCPIENYFQIASPLSRDLAPAKSRRPITIHLMALGFALASIFTPTMDPSIMPTRDGTTIIGSTAPWFRYTHAADVSVIERRNLLVATDILS